MPDSAGVFGNRRLAVGKPSVRPSWRPRTTRPLIAYGRPSRSLARAKSPCCSSWRMRVLEMRSPCRSTASISPAVKPSSAPIFCSRARSPRRRLPKQNSGPIQTSRALRRLTSNWRTKVSAGIAAIAASNRSRPTASTPSSRRISTLLRARVSRGGGVPWAKNSRGSGSNATATAATPARAGQPHGGPAHDGPGGGRRMHRYRPRFRWGTAPRPRRF